MFLIEVLLNGFGLLLILRLGTPLTITLAILTTLFNLLVAIGLIIVKKRPIYALGILILIDIIANVIQLTNGKMPDLLEILLL